MPYKSTFFDSIAQSSKFWQKCNLGLILPIKMLIFSLWSNYATIHGQHTVQKEQKKKK